MQIVELHKGVRIAYSEKEDGVLDESHGKEKEVKANRKTFLDKLDLKSTDVVETAQVHGSLVLALNEENAKMWKSKVVTGIDGLVNDQVDASIMIRVADCVPVVLYDPESHSCAAVHVGWKGAVAGVHLKALELMMERYEANPRTMYSWFGPCAQACCYRSKEEPKQKGDAAWKPYIKKRKGEWVVDIPGYVSQTLLDAGLTKKRMTVSDHCTIESETMHSLQSGTMTSTNLVVVTLMDK